MENEVTKKSKAKLISRISVITLVLTIILALVFDIIIFNDVIKQFIAALIVPSVLFLFLCILFVASFVIIIGFYLVKTEGFWPIKISKSLFNEIMGDIIIPDTQIDQFITCRYILIVLCVVTLLLAIIANIIARSEVKEEILTKQQAKRIGRPIMVLSILGILVSLGAIMLLSSH